MTYNQDNYTQSGTNIDEVKRKNNHSGLTYNEVKMVLANTYKNQKLTSPNQPQNQERN